MIKRLLLLAATALLALTVGCAQLGITQPQTFNEKAYAAALTIDGVQKQAAVLLKAGKISVADAENVLKAADVATQSLAVARTYATSAPATANSKLDAAVAGLTALTAYLSTQGAK